MVTLREMIELTVHAMSSRMEEKANNKTNIQNEYDDIRLV